MRAIRVMVVDDFKQWRTTLRSMVEAVEGFRVVAEAGDGVEAIEEAGRLRPDIVLLDIGLPLLNGIEAAPRILGASPSSKIIFLTQEHDSDVRTVALGAGAEAYLLKSKVACELRRTLDAALQTPSRHRLRRHSETPQSDAKARRAELRLEVDHHSGDLAAVHSGELQTGG